MQSFLNPTSSHDHLPRHISVLIRPYVSGHSSQHCLDWLQPNSIFQLLTLALCCPLLPVDQLGLLQRHLFYVLLGAFRRSSLDLLCPSFPTRPPLSEQAILAQGFHSRFWCFGSCWLCSSLSHGASRMDANRCSSRMDLGHPGSRSSVGPVAQCASGGTGAQSVSRFEAGAQAAVKGEPVDLEDHEARDCIEGLGTRTVGSAHVFGGSSQEGQDGGFRVSKCLFSPTRGLGCRRKCENCPSPEFPGSVPDDVAERRVLEDALAKVHEPLLHRSVNWTSAISFASERRSESRRLRKQWPKHSRCRLRERKSWRRRSVGWKVSEPKLQPNQFRNQSSQGTTS